MSESQGAFRGVGRGFYRDTLVLKSSAADTSSEYSSIPELTQAQERALKRESATFSPIVQADNGRSSIDFMQGEENRDTMNQSPQEFLKNWEPSKDLMMSMERETGVRRTGNWDDDGLDVSEPGSNLEVDIIPSHVRGSTPDSAISRGNFRLNNSTGSHRDFNAGNIHQNAQNNSNHTSPYGMSMRNIVRKQGEGNRDTMNQSPQEFLKNWNDAIPGTSTDDVDLEFMNRRPTETEGQQNSATDPSEKGTCFLPKCLMLVVVLMMIITGIVALIVVVDKKDSAARGSIIPDPITAIECPAVVFGLGDTLNFSCTFDLTHPHREKLIGMYKGFLRPKTKASQGGVLGSIPITFTVFGEQTATIFSATLTGHQATCSSAGSYDVIFLNKTNANDVIHNATVYFTIKQSDLNVTFIQRQLPDGNCTESEFDATCTLQNDCNHYQISFYRNRYGREESLNHLMTCSSNYSDSRGYSVDCSATFPENLFGNYIGFGCKMTAKAQDGAVSRPRELRKPFLLPSCSLRQSCKVYVPSQPTPFNCSTKSNHILKLNSGNCEFETLKECFTIGRKIFKYYKNNANKLTCDRNLAIPVCRLSWCSDYNYIVRDEIAGAAICPGYEEPYFVPQTTETPSSSSTQISR